MPDRKISRRAILKASGAGAAAVVFASPLRAAPPEPVAITPALIEAARKEGKVIYYTSIDLPVSERLPRPSRRSFPASRCG
jgi:iron(III) transport system substrate-binding protein